MRNFVKSVIERMLRVARGRPDAMKGRALILAYHNVVPDDCAGQGDRSLHLPLSRFRRQLDLLQAHCRVISLGELLETGPSPDQLNIVITFDDAYAGAVKLALPELAFRNLPATLFVAPGLLGEKSFWWDELARDRAGLTEALRAVALETHGGRARLIRASLGVETAGETLPEWYRCADADLVAGLGHNPLVALGAHSWSHPNLTRLDAKELEQELSRPLEWLASTGATASRVFAYPYGISSPAVQSAARRAGYEAALLIAGGWYSGQPGDRYAIPRYNVPAGLSDDGLLVRLAGTIPL